MSTYILASPISSGAVMAQGVPFTPISGGTIQEAWPQNYEQWVDITSVTPQPLAGWTSSGGVWAAPPTPVPVGATIIDDADFFDRCTQLETISIQSACTADPALGAALTQGLALGYVDTASSLTKQWFAGLVSAGALTSARATQILDLSQTSPPVSVTS